MVAGRSQDPPVDCAWHARQARIKKAEGRYEDYCWLRTELDLDVEDAGERVGVGLRQAQRYERRLKTEDF